MAKLEGDETNENRYRCKTFKCCKMLRNKHELVNAKPSNAERYY